MNDRQRAVFIDVVDTGSFSRAAEREYVTPQSVSQQVRRLEDELGVRLLDRTSRGVVPTEAGRVFYDGCREVERLLDDAVLRCRQAARPARRLRVALSREYSLALVARFLPQFLVDHPEVQVEYVNPGHTSGVEVLRDDLCDVIETVRPACGDGVGFVPLYRSRRCCLVSTSSPLARRAVLAPRDLVGQDLYVFSVEWARDLQACFDACCPGQLRLQELAVPFEMATQRTQDGRSSVYLLPEHLKDRYEPLVPIPLDVDVATEYGIAYRLDRTDELADFLEAARVAFA
jgi:DNA-binding transcriptional LysR family regulator